MPTFVYNAVDGKGQKAVGTLSAESRAAALDQVTGRGLFPVSVEAQAAEATGGRAKALFQRRKVTATQVEAFTRELANLLAAGVPLARALHILRREASNTAAKDQWTAIHDEVVGGTPLADTLSHWPKSFPTIYVAMVRAGETGGFLDVVLNQIADFRSREAELKGKVKAALVYPVVLAVVMVGVMVFLLTYFIPKFTKIFEDFGAALPALTRAVLAVSHAMTQYGLVLAALVVVVALLLRRALTTESGRRVFERTCLRLPLLGEVLARFALVRFARMLGTLLGAGVPLVTALRVAREALGNQTLADTVSQAIEEVKRGSPLSRSLASTPKLFPPSVLEMVAVAEESSRLDQELIRLAKAYETDLDRRLRMLVSLAEPALLFVMAALIGTVVISMLLPIFTLQDMIK